MLKRGYIMPETGFIEKLRVFSEELDSLGEFAGTDFVWHFSDNDLLMNIPPEQTQHNHPYCRMVKSDPFRKLNKCIQFHHIESFRELKENPGIRIAECHAGVKTLAIGMTVSNTLKGVLFAGPFAGKAAGPLYQELPVITDKQLALLGNYLKRRMDNLFNTERLSEREKPLLTQLSSPDRRIIWAAHYMRNHCHESLTAGKTANACGLSVSRFLHLFHQETGYRFSDWLQRLRVAAACRLLEETPYKLAEIAEISGIHDQSRMTHLFRRYLNTTPGAYRLAKRCGSREIV